MIECIYKNDLDSMKIKGKVNHIQELKYNLLEGDEIFDYLEETITYKFDEVGNIIEETTKFEDLILEPPVIITTKIDYNQNNQVVQKINSNSIEIISSTQYAYDFNGNIISIRSLYGNGKLMNEKRFVYNELNQLIEASEYSRKIAEIDSPAMYESSITPNYTETYEYNSKGELIKEKYEEDEDYKETFENDINGNWIEKNIYEYGDLAFKTIRNIKYA